MTERISVGVKIKGCPLELEGQAWLIKTAQGARSKNKATKINTVSFEHCYKGGTLLIHHPTKEGEYKETVGCEGCLLNRPK